LTVYSAEDSLLRTE